MALLRPVPLLHDWRRFDPVRMGSLIHWFDATRSNEGGGPDVDGSTSGDWKNLAFRGVNPTAVAVTGPTFRAAGRRGMPTHEFNGTSQGLQVNTAAAPWTAAYGREFTIVHAGASTKTGSRGVVLSGRLRATGGSAGGFTWGYESSLTAMRAFDAGGSGDLGTYTVASGWQVNHIRVKDGLWTAGQNGRDIASAAIGFVSLAFTRDWLGLGIEDLGTGSGSVASFYGGHIGEILVFAGPGPHGRPGFLSDGDLGRVVDYLHAKWGRD